MNSEIMTSREVYFVMAWWFVHQSLSYTQAQPNNASPASSKLTTPSDQVPQNYEVAHHDGKAVLSEEQNQHCFKTSILDSGESSFGDFMLYCYPGYRRSRENETCSGPHGCCPCAEGTYMPKPNDCGHCIMKTFCGDYQLEYKDFGSSTNNSECGVQIQKHINDETSPPNTSEAADLACNTPAVAPTYTTKESEQTGISALEHWMIEHVLAITLCAAFSLGGVVVEVLIGLIWLMYYCILRDKKDKRTLVSSIDELKMAERKSNDCSSEADKLTDNADEHRACEV